METKKSRMLLGFIIGAAVGELGNQFDKGKQVVDEIKNKATDLMNEV